MSAEIEDHIRDLKDKDTRDPTQVEEKRLEKELRSIEEQLEALEDPDNGRFMKARDLASALVEYYSKLGEDWREIRFQALEDFRQETHASWIGELGVKSEGQVIEACRIAGDLTDLRKRREELRHRLHALYSNGLDNKESL